MWGVSPPPPRPPDAAVVTRRARGAAGVEGSTTRRRRGGGARHQHRTCQPAPGGGPPPVAGHNAALSPLPARTFLALSDAQGGGMRRPLERADASPVGMLGGEGSGTPAAAPLPFTPHRRAVVDGAAPPTERRRRRHARTQSIRARLPRSDCEVRTKYSLHVA